MRTACLECGLRTVDCGLRPNQEMSGLSVKSSKHETADCDCGLWTAAEARDEWALSQKLKTRDCGTATADCGLRLKHEMTGLSQYTRLRTATADCGLRPKHEMSGLSVKSSKHETAELRLRTADCG
jgi:hypothetical protein